MKFTTSTLRHNNIYLNFDETLQKLQSNDPSLKQVIIEIEQNENPNLITILRATLEKNTTVKKVVTLNYNLNAVSANDLIKSLALNQVITDFGISGVYDGDSLLKTMGDIADQNKTLENLSIWGDPIVSLNTFVLSGWLATYEQFEKFTTLPFFADGQIKSLSLYADIKPRLDINTKLSSYAFPAVRFPEVEDIPLAGSYFEKLRKIYLVNLISKLNHLSIQLSHNINLELLVNALANNKTLKSLSLNDSVVSLEDIIKLISTSKVEEFFYNIDPYAGDPNNPIHAQFVQGYLQFLSGKSRLKKIYFPCVDSITNNYLPQLTQFLSSTPIKHIQLSGTFFQNPNIAVNLCNAIMQNSKLTTLTLQPAIMDSHVPTHIANIIEKHPSLTVINICSSSINDFEAREFLKAIKKNLKFTALILDNCQNISPDLLKEIHEFNQYRKIKFAVLPLIQQAEAIFQALFSGNHDKPELAFAEAIAIYEEAYTQQTILASANNPFANEIKELIDFSLGINFATLTNDENPEYLLHAWHYLYPLCNSNKPALDILYLAFNQLINLSNNIDLSQKYRLLLLLFTSLNHFEEKDEYRIALAIAALQLGKADAKNMTASLHSVTNYDKLINLKQLKNILETLSEQPGHPEQLKSELKSLLIAIDKNNFSISNWRKVASDPVIGQQLMQLFSTQNVGLLEQIIAVPGQKLENTTSSTIATSTNFYQLQDELLTKMHNAYEQNLNGNNEPDPAIIAMKKESKEEIEEITSEVPSTTVPAFLQRQQKFHTQGSSKNSIELKQLSRDTDSKTQDDDEEDKLNRRRRSVNKP